MNSEYLLDCIGLIDDDLIADAEERPARGQPAIPLRAWGTLAACLVLVLALGYAVTHIGMGGGSTAAPAAPSTPAAPAPADPEAPAGSGDNVSGNSSPAEPQAPTSPAPDPSHEVSVGGEPSEDRLAAIMVDGVLYWSTGAPVPGEPDPGAVRVSDSCTDGLPEKDGQNNFSQEPVEYAKIDMGVVVLMDHEWVLFTADPPET